MDKKRANDILKMVITLTCVDYILQHQSLEKPHVFQTVLQAVFFSFFELPNETEKLATCELAILRETGKECMTAIKPERTNLSPKIITLFLLLLLHVKSSIYIFNLFRKTSVLEREHQQNWWNIHTNKHLHTYNLTHWLIIRINWVKSVVMRNILKHFWILNFLNDV